MVSANGRLVMVFNGEIYNFSPIRRELEELGHHFKGTGDSEVILAAFQEWGIDAVHRFIGMFAIALWDRREQRLSLLRDRLGVKPLYYGWDGKTFWFGSELKALRAFQHWQPEIDRRALAEYFQFGYINAPRSIYRGVFKLPPGHWLEINREGEPKLRRYWSIL
ncbi:MAG: asparagine synthetase B, partial [Betaproteobacteria bacterium]